MSDTDTHRRIRQSLDPETLLREAQAVTGLDDVGNPYFLAPFLHQVERAAREVDFTEQGLAQQRADYRRYLVNRLRLQEDLRLHPEILQEDVSDPLVIIGLPRSGTTKMHRMSACEPAALKPHAWQIMNPAPFPGTVAGGPDPRETAGGDDFLDGKRHAVLGAGHAMGAALVESDIALFEQSFDLSVVGITPRILVCEFDHWTPGTPETEGDREAYRYLRTILQYLQWQAGGKRGRPWFLKSIIHHPHIETALQFFPRATFIHCQRDPLDAIPSFAKLQHAAFCTRARDIDKPRMGRSVLDYCAAGMARYLAARDRLGLDDRIVDARYEDIRTNPIPVIRAAYARAGWQLTTVAEAAMRQWERDNEQHKHGTHSYSLAEFGLTRAMVETAFGDFIARFIRR